ncbi:hypothetical protein H072_869 [Dactylellina haptotyla CBS 200.50]|uniref:Uncharacterized protein n=1 Tax=Dactylellina haptotyla (strain CBS 200.50) TaxID=1284197 RepID=S8AQE6_DACHA|nr:hypothetical protein H072_869 [Dactylellina haptotyla CBS 200.50]
MKPSRSRSKQQRPVESDLHHQAKVRQNLSRQCFTEARTTNPVAAGTASTPETQTSGANRLPTEILLQIFGYLLTSTTPIIIDDFKKQDTLSSKRGYWNFTNKTSYNYIGASHGLFLASRYISDTALTVLYSNRFILRLRVNFTRTWLLSIGAENRARLVYLQLGIYSSISQTSWQHNLKRELLRLGADFAGMKRLRTVLYNAEWMHGSNLPSRENIPHDKLLPVERSEMVKFHEELLITYDETPRHATGVLITDTSPSGDPMPENPEVQSKLLSLPENILRRIIHFCHTETQISLFSTSNYYAVTRFPGMSFHDVVLKHHSPCFGYFSLFWVCKSLSELMREVVYTDTNFTLHNRAFAVMSNMVNPADVSRIPNLHLVLGDPNQERMVFIVLCLKGILHRLLKDESCIRRLEIKMNHFSVPYLSVLSPLLRHLRKDKECEVVIKAIDTEGRQPSDEGANEPYKLVESDISWMLDTDPTIVWAWMGRDKNWGHFGELNAQVTNGGENGAGGSVEDVKGKGKARDEGGDGKKKRKKVKDMLQKLKL